MEFANLLVAQAKLNKDRIEDYLKKIKALLYIQADENEKLRTKYTITAELINDTTPNFILATKDYLVDKSKESKARQTELYNVTVSCLDELKRILEQIRVRYTNAFDEQREPLDDEILDDPASDLFETLAAIRSPEKTEPEKAPLAALIRPQTQNLLKAMDEKQCPVELKQEALGAIKKARDGSVPEYFDAIRTLEDTLAKARNLQPSPLQISIGALTINDKGGPRDLLEAAKRMAAALSSLNVTLDG